MISKLSKVEEEEYREVKEEEKEFGDRRKEYTGE
jgi:hypothetical protein